MITPRQYELVELLNRYAEAYYEQDAPVVSDAEYDALYDELLALEAESGEITPDSPTHRVGGSPLLKFEEHTHLGRLWSLDKVRTKEGVRDFIGRVQKAAGGQDVLFGLEYKFDGLTVNLTYDGGELVQGATRGNGVKGEAILPQIKTIRNIPKSIPFKGRMEVQGECIMRLSVLNEYNRTAMEPLKNARNAAAGALRNLDPKVTRARKLDVFCYNIGFIVGKELHNQQEMLAFLKENGLPISDYVRYSDDSAELLREKTKEAIGKLKTIEPLLPPEQPLLKIEFTNYGEAEWASLMPGTELLEGTTTVQYKAKDILEAYKAMIVMTELAMKTTFC